MSSFVINPYLFAAGPVVGVSSGQFMIGGCLVVFTGTGQYMLPNGYYINEGT